MLLFPRGSREHARKYRKTGSQADSGALVEMGYHSLVYFLGLVTSRTSSTSMFLCMIRVLWGVRLTPKLQINRLSRHLKRIPEGRITQFSRPRSMWATWVSFSEMFIFPENVPQWHQENTS